MNERTVWRCEDCSWSWPLASAPPDGGECDNCGGDLAPAVEPRSSSPAHGA